MALFRLLSGVKIREPFFLPASAPLQFHSLSLSAAPTATTPSSGQCNHHASESALTTLFKSQQSHLNFFFEHIDHSQTLAFTRALLNATGTVFFIGVGKSGFVAHKISQTLVSLGMRSAFLSPVDVLHGDIGILTERDVLVLLSKSGATEELLHLVPCARAKGALLIALTSVEGNALAAACDMAVHLPLQRELCPFNLVPVTSTAIQMVFGDTVAITLMEARNLTKEEYAANHPAGKIGKSLIFKVKDVMRNQDDLPICRESDLIMDQLVELTSNGCRCLTVGKMCNRNPRIIGPEAMAVEAMKKMEAPPSPVLFLPVINDENILIGIVPRFSPRPRQKTHIWPRF
ncbi:probable arabinose 5-phosphate isomerase [Vigna unguiculata]|uniref:probable arabinose 5-phosphate isomerase n=1 Tax=Vigna unguiculata TaxID=3917 RepID=UPI001016631C|nr:probable arabinose 5-phosphate isomerase [Vigna unguiculata]